MGSGTVIGKIKRLAKASLFFCKNFHINKKNLPINVDISPNYGIMVL